MRLPCATYRFQFGKDFTFSDARELVDYLSRLGITDIYASPIFRAKSGSTHGYDVIDCNVFSEEIGGRAGFDELAAELKKHGMGLVVDFVPNHMAYDYENAWLRDVLEKGVRSRFRDYFDIDWDSPWEELKGKALAPFLGRDLREAIEAGELRVVRAEQGLALEYFAHRWPLSLKSYADVLGRDAAGSKLWGFAGEDAPGGQGDKARERLVELWGRDEGVASEVDQRLASFNSDSGRLAGVIARQHYLPAHWQQSNARINYRRFFHLNGYVGLRVEEHEVFEAVHRTLLEEVRRGTVTGIRIDHIDGLYDPLGYLVRLRRAAPEAYIVVEKILGEGEELPGEWPVQGTSGYTFMNAAGGIFVRQESAAAMHRLLEDFAGRKIDCDEMVYAGKRLVIERYLDGEFTRIAWRLGELMGADPSVATLEALREALKELAMGLPIYRTYVTSRGPTAQDRQFLREALDAAISRREELGPTLRAIGSYFAAGGEELRAEEDLTKFIMKFQQVTGPVMAKSFEDTFLYQYHRLISLNEVGSDPREFGRSLSEFHGFNRVRAVRWNGSMNATSTHDTKRGEDVRARVNVLSEQPELWEETVAGWRRMNAGFKSRIAGGDAPAGDVEYMIYQTLAGSWPYEEKEMEKYPRRICDYVVKALREGKVWSSWIEPNEEYEKACCEWVMKIMEPGGEFRADFERFANWVGFYGRFNSLAQTLIKTTAPGVPDFYQGAELWEQSLVDPDNRRPVDFPGRGKLFEELAACADAGAAFSRSDGAAKMLVTQRALAARRKYPELFGEGLYIELEARGRLAEHVVAYARCREEMCALAIAPRWLSRVVEEGRQPLGQGVWEDTAVVLPEGFPRRWQHAIAGGWLVCRSELLVGAALAHLPVCLLIGKGASAV